MKFIPLRMDKEPPQNMRDACPPTVYVNPAHIVYFRMHNDTRCVIKLVGDSQAWTVYHSPAALQEWLLGEVKADHSEAETMPPHAYQYDDIRRRMGLVPESVMEKKDPSEATTEVMRKPERMCILRGQGKVSEAFWAGAAVLADARRLAYEFKESDGGTFLEVCSQRWPEYRWTLVGAG